MKKIISGAIFTLTGVILFGIAFIPSSKYIVTLGQWNTPPGKLITSIINTGGILPFIIGLLLLTLGMVFILWGTFEKS